MVLAAGATSCVMMTHDVEQNRRAGCSSTSWIIMTQLVAPAGQNHMKGTFLNPLGPHGQREEALEERSTVPSTGQFGNEMLASRPRAIF